MPPPASSRCDRSTTTPIPTATRCSCSRSRRPSTFTNGSQGTITAVGTDQLSIDPGSGGGIATFTYTVVDNGGLVSAPATVTVRVNRRPTADPVQATIDPDVDTAVPLVGQRSRR